ncbi:unnamed protein product, partial [Scytosiphon promiscuus]
KRRGVGRVCFSGLFSRLLRRSFSAAELCLLATSLGRSLARDRAAQHAWRGESQHLGRPAFETDRGCGRKMYTQAVVSSSVRVVFLSFCFFCGASSLRVFEARATLPFVHVCARVAGARSER